VASEQSREEWQ